jgi:hypothetical protein
MVQKSESKIPKYKLEVNKSKRLVLSLLLVIHLPFFLYMLPLILTRMIYYGPFLIITPLWSILISLHIAHTIFAYKDYTKSRQYFFIHCSIFIPSLFYGFVFTLIVPNLFYFTILFFILWSCFLYIHYRSFKPHISDINEDLSYFNAEEHDRRDIGSSNEENKQSNTGRYNEHKSAILFLLISHLIVFFLLFPPIISYLWRIEYYSNWAGILLPALIWSWIMSLHLSYTIFYFRDYSYEKMKLLTHLAIYVPSLLISFLIFDYFFVLVLIILPIWTIILIWHFQEYKTLKNYEIGDEEDVDQWFEEVEGFSEESLRKIAEEKVKYRDSVKIHFFTYILINILLFVLFLILEIPLISILIFFAWLIGLSLHTVSYILYARGTFPMAKRGVAYHFIIYLTGSIFLLVLTIILITTSKSPQFISSIGSIMSIVIIIWGLALLLHWAIYKLFFSVKIEKNGEIKTRREMQIEKEIQKMKRKLMRE